MQKKYIMYRIYTYMYIYMYVHLKCTYAKFTSWNIFEFTGFDLNMYMTIGGKNRRASPIHLDTTWNSSDFSNLRASVFPRENAASVDHESLVPRRIATELCHDESFIVRRYIKEQSVLA